jgi:hypothetical protein
MKDFYIYNNNLADKLLEESKINSLPAKDKNAISAVIENYKFIIDKII